MTLSVSYVTNSSASVASCRYRILSPARYLDSQKVPISIGPTADKLNSVVVFSKHWTYNDYMYALFCKARGQKVVFDVCDDHFEGPLGDHYKRMVSTAHLITVNSDVMRNRVIQMTGKDATVIEDPVLSERKPYNPERPKGMLWYGQTPNIKVLYEAYPKDCTVPLLVVVPGRLEPPEHFNKPWIAWAQWHEGIINDAAEATSMALLPYPANKQAKSANRVLEALNVGIPVLTNSIPSVNRIPCGWREIQQDLQEQVDSLMKVDWTEEMQLAQAFVDKNYSQEAIGERWKEELEALV